MNKNLRAHPMKNPIILALDVDTRDQALKIADDLSDIVGGIKLGPRLCLRYGMDFVKEMAQRAPIFLDNKHFDIPSTMEAAVRASFEAGASLVTVHALSGKEALTRMAAVEKELNQQRPFRILAVTILTSWDQNSLPVNMKSQPIAQHVTELASLVKDSGLSGVVCSPHELDLLQNRDLYLVTPGIRFSMQDSGDQKRIMGPKEALRAGASALVVGRPILEASNIKEAATDFVMAMYEEK
ncbi:orotidine-5'-phosphate decarboxylase [Bdellovibrio bacteriovorus]|uniref:Orotidine 5'-phosphate decarboxylase n=1 Tax=Bdellovibrio bacteriovorus (strain ATCC 15356 / DSM 50701 / NCIMB 9529 / HD100) TaxID=264462 RepID=Q6MIZ8_BDEBA|nr:orotidine-5'-phosphate decarboxylase [Bdellovibrio bacteriovorus]BEV69361.1 Orotidine 5'-phosphate decarboxylase [Bdellovibrio bacteriovorus]CAE80765.1 orotidine 5'-phosphate decarboxylase [Bdellovibrio bacteriovorus HD100]